MTPAADSEVTDEFFPSIPIQDLKDQTSVPIVVTQQPPAKPAAQQHHIHHPVPHQHVFVVTQKRVYLVEESKFCALAHISCLPRVIIVRTSSHSALPKLPMLVEVPLTLPQAAEVRIFFSLSDALILLQIVCVGAMVPHDGPQHLCFGVAVVKPSSLSDTQPKSYLHVFTAYSNEPTNLTGQSQCIELGFTPTAILTDSIVTKFYSRLHTSSSYYYSLCSTGVALEQSHYVCKCLFCSD